MKSSPRRQGRAWLMLAAVATSLVLACGAALAAGEEADPGGAGLETRSIKEFGPTSTPAEAQETFRKALQALTEKQGGILIVPEDVPTQANLENTARWTHSTDPASCKLTDWKVGPGVLVIDNREGNLALRVPQLGERNNAGITLERTMRVPPGDSLTHWTQESVLNIENNIVHGPCNYMEWILEPVKAGENARFYVPTARNLFEGMYLNAHHGPGYRAPVARITVKEIGYDKQKKMYYFTAHTTTDHTKGAIVQNKSHVPGVRIVSNLNAANQTFDLYNRRNQYANGDSYMFDASFNYMGNVHSMPGDENGVCYMAGIRPLTNVFTGRVRELQDGGHSLVFQNAQNAHTLANSRPLVNLNEEKWITAGKVVIVPPSDPTAPHDTTDTGEWTFMGKSYPSSIGPGPATGYPELHVGGLIRGDADCPWDESIIGRFFAVDEDSEYVKHRGAKPKLRRWYEIADLTVNPDGTKDIQIKRYWWGAKAWDSVTLYDPQNYTRDEHVQALSYVIAPGAYVNDVSRAVGSPSQRQGKPPYTVGITPHPDSGEKFDFEPGDEIEQAIGADPFKPQAIRAWCFDAVQGAWPSTMVDLANFGAVARYSAISVRGGPNTLEACENRRERRPAWDSVLSIDCAATVGIKCSADFADAAILLKQPNHEQKIKWHYGERGEGKAPQEATLGVSTQSGDLTFEGGDARFSGSLIAGGLSAGEAPARNLRGKNVEVKQGDTRVQVTFPQPEADADYAVFVEQSWLTARAVAEQSAEGFTVQFEKAAPEGAKLHWMIVR